MPRQTKSGLSHSGQDSLDSQLARSMVSAHAWGHSDTSLWYATTTFFFGLPEGGPAGQCTADFFFSTPT